MLTHTPMVMSKLHRPGEHLYIDFCHVGNMGEEAMDALVAIDSASGFMQVFPVLDQTAATLIEILNNGWFNMLKKTLVFQVNRVPNSKGIPNCLRGLASSRVAWGGCQPIPGLATNIFGILRFLTSDNGPQLVSTAFSDFLHDMGVKHIPTSLYHPQADMAEAAVKKFKTSLQRCCADEPGVLGWTRFVPCIVAAYAVTRSETMSMTPAAFFFSTDAVHGDEAFTLRPFEGKQLSAEQLADLAWQQVENHCTIVRTRANAQANRGIRTHWFEPGEWVTIRTRPYPVNLAELGTRRRSPYQVVVQYGPTYHLAYADSTPFTSGVPGDTLMAYNFDDDADIDDVAPSPTDDTEVSGNNNSNDSDDEDDDGQLHLNFRGESSAGRMAICTGTRANAGGLANIHGTQAYSLASSALNLPPASFISYVNHHTPRDDASFSPPDICSTPGTSIGASSAEPSDVRISEPEPANNKITIESEDSDANTTDNSETADNNSSSEDEPADDDATDSDSDYGYPSNNNESSDDSESDTESEHSDPDDDDQAPANTETPEPANIGGEQLGDSTSPAEPSGTSPGWSSSSSRNVDMQVSVMLPPPIPAQAAPVHKMASTQTETLYAHMEMTDTDVEMTPAPRMPPQQQMQLQIMPMDKSSPNLPAIHTAEPASDTDESMCQFEDMLVEEEENSEDEDKRILEDIQEDEEIEEQIEEIQPQIQALPLPPSLPLPLPLPPQPSLLENLPTQSDTRSSRSDLISFDGMSETDSSLGLIFYRESSSASANTGRASSSMSPVTPRSPMPLLAANAMNMEPPRPVAIRADSELLLSHHMSAYTHTRTRSAEQRIPQTNQPLHAQAPPNPAQALPRPLMPHRARRICSDITSPTGSTLMPQITGLGIYVTRPGMGWHPPQATREDARPAQGHVHPQAQPNDTPADPSQMEGAMHPTSQAIWNAFAFRNPVYLEHQSPTTASSESSEMTPIKFPLFQQYLL
ncbi:hypothetical protein COEREDRAFT_12265 [Coemansia reversa NRRL 1564]|uniref:Integrase catalytic domain-containing protein n=1 Tax=Coemansia reversa (strain ATCC 12441 / NRRL 1564) TaxID=763665 RepID=A0A2G5B163_COERN|nr:hypothetical protein COEREDRAFT_12265 [Coemansia reversa NRRL 1564]|eukprot:PIA12753.1 hypothetical protein COEREDRAFT_12265 [Coemansia reversa NRRL 1564]